MLFHFLLSDFIFLFFFIFIFSLVGLVFSRHNLLLMLMSLELLLLSVNLTLLFFSVYLDDLLGQLFALLILTVAAAEASIGLAILVIFFRLRGTILVQYIHFIKG